MFPGCLPFSHATSITRRVSDSARNQTLRRSSVGRRGKKSKCALGFDMTWCPFLSFQGLFFLLSYLVDLPEGLRLLMDLATTSLLTTSALGDLTSERLFQERPPGHVYSNSSQPRISCINNQYCAVQSSCIFAAKTTARPMRLHATPRL